MFGKNLVTVAGDQKVKFKLKIGFFPNMFQTLCQIFLILCMKLNNNNCRRVTQLDFGNKILTPLPGGSKGQPWAKNRFFYNIFQTPHRIFLIFLMK